MHVVMCTRPLFLLPLKGLGTIKANVTIQGFFVFVFLGGGEGGGRIYTYSRPSKSVGPMPFQNQIIASEIFGLVK